MDEPEFFPLSLGGRTWNLPHLPFGVVKRLQSRALRLNSELSQLSVVDLDEAKLDQLLDLTHEALKSAEQGVTKEALEALPFTTSDLIGAQTAVMKARGLIRDSAPGEGGNPDPKALSTTSSPA